MDEAGIAPTNERFNEVYFKVRDRLYDDYAGFKEYAFNHRLAEVLRLCGFEIPESDEHLQAATRVFLGYLVDSFRIENQTHEVLKELHGLFRLAVVSNMAIIEAVPIALKRFDIEKYFDAIVISVTVGYRKPSPIIFKEALKEPGTSPEETVFVGDSLYHDIQGAKAVGMKTVWLKRKNRSKENATVVPDKIIEDLIELPKILETLCM